MNGASATSPRRPHDLPTTSVTRLSALSSTTSSSQTNQLSSLEAALSAHADAEDPAMKYPSLETHREVPFAYTDSQKNLERVRMERDAYKAKLLKLGENPDAIVRGYREKEKQLKPSSSSNGMRQASDRHTSQSSGPARPTRHQSADTGLGTISHALTPDWLPASRVPPTVTVSLSDQDAFDVSATPAVYSSPPVAISGTTHTHQYPSTKSASPSTTYHPGDTLASGSSTSSPLETTPSSSQSGLRSLAKLQAASRESRITLPDEAKQYISSAVDSPAHSPRATEHSPGHNPGSNANITPDSATDKSSTRRDMSDGEFLDLEDSDSLYDSAADHSLTSPSPQDGRNPPDDIQQPRFAVLPPAADDFPLPPGTVNPSHGELTLGTPQAIPAIERARKSVIPEQESQVQFRALPLLSHDLPYTRITVTNSSIRPNDRGKDVLSFVVLVDPGNQKEPYMIEKLYSDVLGLDQRIRSRYGRSIHKRIPQLPDGKLWRDHAPSRVDQRKAVLEQYVQALINLPVKNSDEIIAFLTSDVIKETNKPVAREGYKEGYLTKRGKNFGGWKTRFFVLQGPQLEYYESRGGQHLGSIAITGAQIGRQHRPADRRESEEEGEYRHAFLIIEPKKATGGSHRHVLCAESDTERDSWVEILVRYVSGAYDEHASPQSSLHVNTSIAATTSSSQPRSSTSSIAPVDLSSPYRDRRQGQRGMSKEDINIGPAVPLSRLAQDPLNAKLFQATPQYEETSVDVLKNTNIPPDSEQATPVFSEAQTARRLLDKGPPSSTPSTELPLSSSLPTTSPLDTVGNDLIPSIGPRSNSELGHYPDLFDPQGSRGGRNPQPSPERSRQRQGHRTSLHHTLESAQSSESPSPGERPASPEGVNQNALRADMPAKVKISGPMNGTLIPPGHKFGAKEPASEVVQSDRRDKVKSRMFQWSWRQQGEKSIVPTHVHRAVFGVTLEESLEVAQIAGLPAIVFRCIQYLEKMKADQEEEGDVDLLRSNEYWDPHAIAGLLKSFFRDLPSSILTRDLHMRFLSVMDLVDSQERITELSHLIAILPVANYSLLRALTAHLISIVQNANVNKMTMRNVGIVFSPTLGIPAGVFSLMLAEFNRVFNVDGGSDQTEFAVDETGNAVPLTDDSGGTDISHRNSKHYLDATTDQLLGLAGRKLTGPDDDGQSDDTEELSMNTESGADTTDQDLMIEYPQENQSNSQPTQLTPELRSLSRSRASNVAAARGLGIRVASSDGPRHGQIGLPVSPRPPIRSPRAATQPQDGAGLSALAQQQQR
ncbi:hypothetical protein B0F90DRAFT_1814774 [Multifurca ochricompacta]|uniref:RhoGAP-domain-containing protein n=1 Tax=Multifurca ochricompacta TaxID=376703 RepID=A0AAD4MB53_9AGAM|nr:hypothetical protein B0F90DRAFT_1814774 [Multifurca ochricompacta]